MKFDKMLKETFVRLIYNVSLYQYLYQYLQFCQHDYLSKSSDLEKKTPFFFYENNPNFRVKRLVFVQSCFTIEFANTITSNI